MKVCFVKQPCMVNLTLESVKYSGSERTLSAFAYRSQNLEFIIETKADVWVVAGLSARCLGAEKDPAGMDAMYQASRVVTWADIPWDDYDVVISHDPIIDDKTIKSHLDILWVYHEPEHRGGRARGAAYGGPRGAYDLFWDDYMRASPELVGLPQSVGFPYFRNPEILRELIEPANELSVFVDSRHIHDKSEKERGAMRTELESLCGLPVRYAALDSTVTQKRTRRQLIAAKKMLGCKEYLELLGSCKYFLGWRKKRVNGQAALEAAALGLIVVASSNGVYHEMFCHPRCVIPPGGPPRIGLRIIQGIEKDVGLQKEVVEHQDRMIMKRFWEKPFKILHKALELKRHSV